MNMPIPKKPSLKSAPMPATEVVVEQVNAKPVAALPPASVLGPQSIKIQLSMVWNHIWNNFLNGFCLGLIFLLTIQLDKFGHFQKFLDELLTSIHPAVVLIGFMGGCSYMLGSRNISYFFSRICRSWFDLTQQFFTLGLGAFLPLKLGIFISSVLWNRPSSNDLREESVNLAAILLGAIVIGGLWALKDEIPKYPTVNRLLCGVVIFFCIVLVLASLLSSDGGISVLSDLEEILRNAVFSS